MGLHLHLYSTLQLWYDGIQCAVNNLNIHIQPVTCAEVGSGGGGGGWGGGMGVV